jgi:hypothetical protein
MEVNAGVAGIASVGAIVSIEVNAGVEGIV